MNSSSPADGTNLNKPPILRSSAARIGGFRGAVLRGLAVVLPPLLTIVILLWIGRTIAYYVLEPVAVGARNAIAWAIADVRDELPAAQATDDATVALEDGQEFKRLPNGDYVPLRVYQTVRSDLGMSPLPDSGHAIYLRYVESVYLQPYIVVPVFVLLFIAVMYLLGSFLAGGIGRALWGVLEQAISRLPLVRAVYSSTKQVTSFMVNEAPLGIRRVVAVEYPCKGVWSLAFVTGEGMADLHDVAGEPMLTVLIDTSPTPFTGFTAVVRRSEVIDLDLTVEQALEFIVSCGVVIPPQHLLASARESKTLPTGNVATAERAID